MQAVAGLVLLAGCSFAFTSGPPANHRQLPYFNCSESRIAPGLDVAWTVLQGLNVATAASQSDQEWDDLFSGNPPFSRQTAIGLYVGLAAVGAAGAYYGFHKTGECRAAKQELMMRAMQGGGMQPQGPGTWPPPAAPPPAPAPQPQPPPPPAPPAPEPAPPPP